VTQPEPTALNRALHRFAQATIDRVRGAGNGEVSDLRLREWRPVARLHVPHHQVPAARFRAIDAHTHLGRWLTPDGGWLVDDVDSLIELIDDCNVGTLVNLDGGWGDELESNLDRYDRAHPGRFVTFCHVDWTEIGQSGFGERLAASLARSVRVGAAGLKVWKDLGLHVRDRDARLVLPDDPRLAPLWETAGELDIPVAIHTADPVAFFDPIDERNERLEQLVAHPDWSFADPAFPRFERLMDSLEALVAQHPATTFIGVHMGCYSENLGWVGRMLDSYPNFHVDIAARLAELGRQPRATRELIVRHSDRVLFGTDEYPPDARLYATHFRFLETADEWFAHTTADVPLMGRWGIYGIDLPEDVLRKVYSENAARLIPAVARMREKGVSR
jgi:predicted TIM-barrel fold metal-dependent hydrolase